MIEYIKVPVPLFNALEQYLTERPWKEVNNLIHALEAAAKNTVESEAKFDVKESDGSAA